MWAGLPIGVLSAPPLMFPKNIASVMMFFSQHQQVLFLSWLGWYTWHATGLNGMLMRNHQEASFHWPRPLPSSCFMQNPMKEFGLLSSLPFLTSHPLFPCDEELFARLHMVPGMGPFTAVWPFSSI